MSSERRERPAGFTTADLVEWAREGDTSAAKELLGLYLLLTNHPELFPRVERPDPVEVWLYGALRQIVRGVEPDIALCLRPGPGRPKKPRATKCTPREMAYAREVNRLQYEEGFSQPEAVKAVAADFDISDDYVKRCYGKCIPKRWRWSHLKKSV